MHALPCVPHLVSIMEFFVVDTAPVPSPRLFLGALAARQVGKGACRRRDSVDRIPPLRQGHALRALRGLDPLVLRI